MFASGSKLSASDFGGMVKRGDLTANDFWLGSGITCDNADHELDLSSKAPDGAKFVLLAVRMKSPNLGHLFTIRENGHTDGFNYIKVTSLVTTEYMYRTEWIGCDADRKVKYFGSASLIDAVINVLAWHT